MNAIINPLHHTSDDMHDLQALEHPSMFNACGAVFWEKAKGARVFAQDHEWIDFTSSVAVANAGHSNDRIIEAIRAALDNELITTYTFPHRMRLTLYRRLRALLRDSTGKDYKLHFMCSGTEAVEAAVDVVAEYYRDKDPLVIVSFVNAFHGNTLKSSAASGHARSSMYQDDEGKRIYFVKVPYNSRQAVDAHSFSDEVTRALRELQLPVSAVGGVLFEPYQGRGVIVADQSFALEVAGFCKQHGALLIVDEIQSGFYRTGTRFAFEHFGITPDIVCLGKGLTSSLPMSGIAVRDEVFDTVTSIDIASTHSTNPLACAAALASISVLEDETLKEQQQKLSTVLAAGIDKIHKTFPDTIGYREAFGLVGSLQFTQEGLPSEDIARAVVQACHQNGLLVTGPHGEQHAFIRLTPPLVISTTELRKGLKILESSIRHVVA